MEIKNLTEIKKFCLKPKEIDDNISFPIINENILSSVDNNLNIFLNNNKNFSENKENYINLILIDEEENNLVNKNFKIQKNNEHNKNETLNKSNSSIIQFSSIDNLSENILKKINLFFSKSELKNTNQNIFINDYDDFILDFYTQNYEKIKTYEDILSSNSDSIICKITSKSFTKKNNIKNFNLQKDNYHNNNYLTPLKNEIDILNSSNKKENKTFSLFNHENKKEPESKPELEKKTSGKFLIEENYKNEENFDNSDSNHSFYSPSSRRQNNNYNIHKSDSYLLTNRSFYSKIKARNIDINKKMEDIKDNNSNRKKKFQIKLNTKNNLQITNYNNFSNFSNTNSSNKQNINKSHNEKLHDKNFNILQENSNINTKILFKENKIFKKFNTNNKLIKLDPNLFPFLGSNYSISKDIKNLDNMDINSDKINTKKNFIFEDLKTPIISTLINISKNINENDKVNSLNKNNEFFSLSSMINSTKYYQTNRKSAFLNESEKNNNISQINFIDDKNLYGKTEEKRFYFKNKYKILPFSDKENNLNYFNSSSILHETGNNFNIELKANNNEFKENYFEKNKKISIEVQTYDESILNSQKIKNFNEKNINFQNQNKKYNIIENIKSGNTQNFNFKHTKNLINTKDNYYNSTDSQKFIKNKYNFKKCFLGNSKNSTNQKFQNNHKDINNSFSSLNNSEEKIKYFQNTKPINLLSYQSNRNYSIYNTCENKIENENFPNIKKENKIKPINFISKNDRIKIGKIKELKKLLEIEDIKDSTFKFNIFNSSDKKYNLNNQESPYMHVMYKKSSSHIYQLTEQENEKSFIDDLIKNKNPQKNLNINNDFMTNINILKNNSNEKFNKSNFDNKILLSNNQSNILHNNKLGFSKINKQSNSFNNRYYSILYDDIKKIKLTIQNFVNLNLQNLISNEFIDEKFKMLSSFSKSDFEYKIKKEFIFYTYLTTKIQKKISKGYIDLIDSDNNFNITENTKSFSAKINELNSVVEEVMKKIQKNISDFINYIKDLNYMKILLLNVDFFFVYFYLFKNENILTANKNIIVKLIEFISDDKNLKISFSTYEKIKLLSKEEIIDFSLDDYFKHINFLKNFFKLFLKSEKKNLLQEIKYCLGTQDVNLNTLISSDEKVLIKNSENVNYRVKIASIYLNLIKFLA